MGIRVSARIEHRATPITRTTTETGLRRALRRSHMAKALPLSCPAAVAGKAQGPLAPPQRRPGSARRPNAPMHRQFPLAPAGSPHRRHLQVSRGRLGNEHVLGFRCFGRLRVRQACSPQLFLRLRAKPAPCRVVPSNLGLSGHNEPFPRAHSRPRPPSSNASRKCRTRETLPSDPRPSWTGPEPGPQCLQEIFRLGPSRCHVRTRRIGNRASDSRSGREYAPETATLRRALAVLSLPGSRIREPPQATNRAYLRPNRFPEFQPGNRRSLGYRPKRCGLSRPAVAPLPG